MNNKKRLCFLIFIVCFINLFCFKIAYSKSPSSGSSGIGNNSTAGTVSCNIGWCWSSGYRGIRVTFYNYLGEAVSNSLDFLNSSSTLPFTAYSNSNKNNHHSKLEYLYERATINNYGSWHKYNSNDLINGTINIGNLGNLETNEFFRDVLGIRTLQDIKTIFLDKENEFFNNHYKSNGVKYTFDDIIGSKEYYYLIVEPITILIKNGSTRYYGTYRELQEIYFLNNYFSGQGAISLFSQSQNRFGKMIYLDPNKKIGGTSWFATGSLTSLRDNAEVKRADNRFGIGILWLKDLVEPGGGDDPSDTPYNPNYSDFPTCEVNSSLAPCQDRVDYSYSNCTLDNNPNNYIKASSKIHLDAGEKDVDICKISCSERYYIATYQVANSFKPTNYVNGEYVDTVVAGKYFPVFGPVVYHKKTCDFISNYKNLEEIIKTKYSKNNYSYSSGKWEGGCKYKYTYCAERDPETRECIRHSSTWKLANDNSDCMKYWNAVKKSFTRQCENLEKTLKQMDEESVSRTEIGEQKGKELLLTPLIINNNGTYEKANYNYNLVFDSDNVNREYFKEHDFGYKNTYVYGLEKGVNQYINLLTISDNELSGNFKTTSKMYYDFGYSNATTPIKIMSGTYYNNIDYSNLFSTTFKNILKEQDVNVDNDVVKNSYCPYTIIQRNVDNICVPTSSNNYCGNPDKTFSMPKIKMIYRPINLNYPFPGKDGNGRTPGLNWNIEAINQYITNNRDVETDAVYSTKPLYTIKLDSSKIKAIREYNKTHAYDDFELDCTEGTGTECISKFLRDYDLITSGTCKDVTKDNFYSCADK